MPGKLVGRVCPKQRHFTASKALQIIKIARQSPVCRHWAFAFFAASEFFGAPE